MKNCNEESDKGFFLEVDAHYPEKLHELYNDSYHLRKIKNLVTSLHDKNEYVVHMRNLKQAFHGVIKFNQKDWIKSYVDMNTELRQMQKIILRKIRNLIKWNQTNQILH